LSDLQDVNFTNDDSYRNIINNARFLGDALALTTEDIICCPPPLFHCFGLVMGFLGSFTRGCTVVFPSQQFDAGAIVDAVDSERCTVIYGVPTMFGAELDALARQGRRLTSLTRALASGAPVPPSMVKRLNQEMGIQSVLIAYGMTETSPVTFATTVNDSHERRQTTVGKVFPHTKVKVVDLDGNTVPCGVQGEICTSGYALQRGYLKNLAKTDEAMRRDREGRLWMHTGDKGVLDSEGYLRITGRIKDMIIRGKLHPYCTVTTTTD
jgi:acyl-CoA synthetase (AMP-forming)/AMP-acid ligase II